MQMARIDSGIPGDPADDRSTARRLCRFIDDCKNAFGVAGKNDRRSGLGDSRLFRDDLFDRIAKKRLMIDAKLGDPANGWSRNDIGGESGRASWRERVGQYV